MRCTCNQMQMYRDVCVMLKKPHQLNATSEIWLLCLSILLHQWNLIHFTLQYGQTYVHSVNGTFSRHFSPIFSFLCMRVWTELECRLRCYTKLFGIADSYFTNTHAYTPLHSSFNAMHKFYFLLVRGEGDKCGK